FVGTILNWGLFALLLVQVVIYYMIFPKDRRWSKILVGFIFIVECLQVMSNTRDALRIFAVGWGDLNALYEVGWAWFCVPI
ncbi:hypothetical protein B0H13DRAFT_1536059, partial [Mycena leptocephala]